MSQVEQLDDSFLDNEPTEVEETEVVTETVETEEVKTEETEETKTEKTDEVKADEVVVETTATKEKDSWTFSQAMDEREKRQKVSAENEELKAKLAGFEKKDDVSVFEDEAGFKQQLKDDSKIELDSAILGMSKAYATRELGAEVVEKAAAWYAEEGIKSPYMMQQIHDSNLKFHKVVELYEQEQNRLDPEAARAKMKAEIIAELKADTTEEKPDKPITPSLATSRSSGTETTTVAESLEDILKD